MTGAEILLWRYLKGKQLLGHKFRRQHSVGPYVLDFYCPEARLAIEVDGESHHSNSARAHDRRKTQYMERFNIRVLRFSDENVFSNLDGVLKCIGVAIPSQQESTITD
jgi:very-short-patch-repair endonuclease